MIKGDRFVSNPDSRLAHRHLIEITRVAKDGQWADIFVSNWACGWSKRQHIGSTGRFLFPYEPFEGDLTTFFEEQEKDHMDMLHAREEGEK